MDGNGDALGAKGGEDVFMCVPGLGGRGGDMVEVWDSDAMEYSALPLLRKWLLESAALDLAHFLKSHTV